MAAAMDAGEISALADMLLSQPTADSKSENDGAAVLLEERTADEDEGEDPRSSSSHSPPSSFVRRVLCRNHQSSSLVIRLDSLLCECVKSRWA